MPHPLHSVKVETKIVDRVQDLRQHLVRCIKMAQIGPRITFTNATGALFIERSGILRIASLLDRHFSGRREQEAVARRACRKNQSIMSMPIPATERSLLECPRP